MRPRDPEVLTGLAVFPVGTSDSGQKPKVRRYPYIILPLDMPKEGIPEGSFFMESLVFSLIQHPPRKVLADYCKFKGLDSSKFVCHPVVFGKNMRQQGPGAISIQRNGDRFRMGVNWRP